MESTKVKAYRVVKEEHYKCSKGEALLILLPKMPFESHISSTKETWACEHQVTMVFI
jgi:hypothetical protein